MNEHPSYLVYSLLPAFLKSRKLKAVTPNDLDIARDRFTTELDHTGYFRLDAEDANRRIVSILLLAPSGKYTDHGPQLRGLISSLDSQIFVKTGRLLEVIIIAPEETAKKKNMTDVIQAFRDVVAKNSGTERTEALAEIYNMYPYHVFSLDIPRAQSVPKHTIANPTDVRAFLIREHLTLADLRRVSASDAPVIWIGAQPGQVVQIVTPSETSGEAYSYNFVS